MSNTVFKKRLKRVIACFTLLFIVLTNYGMPLYAIAAESNDLFESSIFKKSEIEMTAEFVDGGDDTIADVNNQVVLSVELNPTVDGYLKQGILELNLSGQEENNFKIAAIAQEAEDSLNEKYNERVRNQNSSVSNDTSEVTENAMTVQSSNKRAELLVAEDLGTDEVTTYTTDDQVLENEELVEETTDLVSENELEVQETTTYVDENVSTPIYDDSFQAEDLSAVTTQVETIEEIQKELTEEVPLVIMNDESTVETTTEELVASEDVDTEAIIDEEEYIEKVVETTQEQQVKRIFIDASSVKLQSNNQVLIENVSSKTKIYITLVYVQKDTIDVSSLLSTLEINLNGSFVNDKLEEVNVSKQALLTLGWKYTKDIELKSEFVKVSPFAINDSYGSIVENEIRVIRDIDDIKYLPLKSTELEIKVPTLNNKYPIMVDVTAKQLLATKGESVGYVSFSKDNWKYDENNNTIKITVNNNKNDVAVNTKGEDIYVVTYRYEDYVQSDDINLAKNVSLVAEEYSYKTNVIKKSITSDEVETINDGELITYSYDTSEEKISKGTIYANYFVDEKFSTEFSSVATVKILTQDMLDQVILTDLHDSYVDREGNTYKADDDIYYSGINLKYNEIEDLLKGGSNIQVLDGDDNQLYVFTEDNTKGANDAQIVFNQDVKDIKILVNNVSNNGSFTVEFVKKINTTNYTMYQFSMFTKLISSIRAKVKYIGLDTEFNLNELNVVKDFAESYTKANIYMNPTTLNTVSTNENVEIKIVLNNNSKHSDMYKNPGFEIVFPSYISDVSIQNINIANNEDLRIDDFRTYTDGEGCIRTAIYLEGVQQNFSTANLTNGTNIIINCNIDLTEFTPKKEDQIKLYYYNEAVSNYESQTMWKINQTPPSGMIRATNGFDAVVFDYKAPSGLITATGIRNYDGNLSLVSSVKQGDVTAEIYRDSESQIAKMELTTINNTGNPCADLVLIGRIPFEGNKDVITGEDLGTTVNTVMMDVMKQDGKNPVGAKIYYSTNPTANKNLADGRNEWKSASQLTSLTDIKSFLIVVQGTIKPGSIFKYSYDFMIPEGLSYDNAIYGTYAAYYNNVSSSSVVYESNSSDRVGLKTGTSPKLEVSLSVDAGDNKQVKGYSRITYKVDVTNVGSNNMENVVLDYDIPKYTQYVKLDSSPIVGDHGWTYMSNIDILSSMGYSVEEIQNMTEEQREKICTTVDLGTIKPKETKTFTYSVKTLRGPELEDVAIKEGNRYYVYSDEIESDEEVVGLNQEGENSSERAVTHKKVYITEAPPVYIENKVKVSTTSLEETVESNVVKNQLINSTFDKTISVSSDATVKPGSTKNYVLKVVNTKDLTNVNVTFYYSSFNKIVSSSDSKNIAKITNDEKNNKITFKFDKVNKNQVLSMNLQTEGIAIDINNKKEDVYFEVSADNTLKEKSTAINQEYVRPILMLKDITTYVPEKINEEQNLTVSTEVMNNGTETAVNATLEVSYDDLFVVDNTSSTDSGELNVKNEDNKVIVKLPTIEPGDSINVNISFRAQNLAGSGENRGTVKRKLYASYQNEQKLDDLTVTVVNSLKTEAEIRAQQEEEANARVRQAEQAAAEKAAQDAYVDQQKASKKPVSENRNTNTSYNASNNNNSTNNQQTNTQSTSSTQNTSRNVAKYSVTGKIWVDDNKNGAYEKTEDELKDVVVSLINAETDETVSTTSSSSSGRYGFSNIPQGKYYVIFKYNSDKYEPTIYQNNGIPSENNSDATIAQNDNTIAVTDSFELTSNVSDLDLGLVQKSAFDIEVHKYLVGATVTLRNGKSTHYTYDDKEIAKIEIRSSQLNGAKVELEYAIALTNIGKVEGYAEQVIDVLPEGMENSSKNEGVWSLSTDNKFYSQNLANSTIKPGETRRLKLVLVKNMTGENTGVVSNRAELISSISNEKQQEDTDNNSNVQNTFIMPSTGREATNITLTLIGIAVVVVIYLVATKKIKIPNINEKKFYK